MVVKYGLVAKDRDLSRGLGADGKPMKALHPKTIKYRKSEVGPVTKTAPPLIPALELSRVRSLLTGRAHAGSAEFWWKFDSVSGDSFAVILRYQRDEYGRDVFGLSPRGTAWTLARATADWETWKASPEAERLTAGRISLPAARQVRKPLPKVAVKQNLEYSELFPGQVRYREGNGRGAIPRLPQTQCTRGAMEATAGIGAWASSSTAADATSTETAQAQAGACTSQTAADTGEPSDGVGHPVSPD